MCWILCETFDNGVFQQLNTQNGHFEKYVEFIYHINESEFKLQCVIIIICVKTIKVKTVILVLDP